MGPTMGDVRILPEETTTKNSITLVSVLSVVLITTACASIERIPFSPVESAADGNDAAPWVPEPAFDYTPAPITAEQETTERKTRYEISRVSFPSVGDNGQEGDLVAFDYHRSTLPGSHPAVIVLPIWGRQVYPSNAVIRTLRKRSNGRVHVLNFLGESFLIDWPELAVLEDESEFVETWREGAEREITTVIDIRRLIDWTEAQTEIDSAQIGVIGFSHGAMLAPAIAAHEPRISALVLVMGGAHPHQIITRCEGARTEGVQLHAEEVFGWSKEEMETRLEPMYAPLDAANYPGRMDPNRVLIFEAGRDECVPQSTRDALWQAMGRPERYIIDRKHRPSFYTMTPLHLNWMRKKVWSFFETRLLECPAYSNSDPR
jgi:dienelactone hydrolase